MNITLPVVSGTIMNVIIAVRILYQKHLMKQKRMWTKNWRLVAQLIFFAIPQSLLWVSLCITTLIMLHATTKDPFFVQLNTNILPYGIYIIVLLCPFLLLLGLPEIWPRYFKRSRIGQTAIPSRRTAH
jgi:hypothetical protein